MNFDLDTIETTFDLVAPRGEELMDVFYARLFAAAPAVEPLVAGTDIRRQMDALVPRLRELGARHVAYGARPQHYVIVGEALIASLAQIAGEAWRPEHELAWGAALAVIADAMLSGARDAELDLAA